MTKYYPLEVIDIKKNTPDAVKVTFNVPDDQLDDFKFTPGQYLSFRKEIDGEEVRRSYSICSSKFDDNLSIGIKKVSGGLFSSWVLEELQVGDRIEAMPPMGNFCIEGKEGAGKHYLAFAVGSGITPILSILKSTLKEDDKATFTLVYGNRTINSIMFREELEALKNHYMTRLSLIQIFSGAGQEIALFSGRVDRQKCEDLLDHWVDLSTVDQVLICGPKEMLETVSETLVENNFPREKIRFELFGTRKKDPKTAADTEVSQGIEDMCEVRVQIDGAYHDFTMPKQGACFLQTARAHNIDVPSSCEAGVCSTCRAKVLEGDVAMGANYTLEDYEISQGAVLTCQMEVLSDKVVLTFER